MSTASPPVAWLKITVITLLVVLALGTRLPAPWRAEVTNDEMYHIKSWRNRYRTNDVLPLFVRRLDRSHAFSSSLKEQLKQLYYSSPLFQRFLCIKSEYGSYGYGLLGEAIEAASHSSIVALRIPSVLASLGTILLAYLLGKTLKDEPLGFLLASFFAAGLLPQVYAGIGRVHGLTQFALVALLYMMALDHRQKNPSPRRFLIVALLAQTAHLTAWGIIGILVIGELLHRYLVLGTPLRELIRQTWWYAALSVLLLGVIATGLIDTSMVGANVYYPGFKTWWQNLCLASPFGHLAGLGEEAMWASGVAWVLLILNGLRLLFADDSPYREFRWPFLVATVVSFVVPFYASSGVRHLMIYGVVPMVVSAIGARALFASPRAALAGAAVMLAVFTPLSLACRECAYRYILFPADIPYSPVARRLAAEIKPGDVWISWPYFACCPLYPYADLPEPIMPITGDEFHEALHNRPADHACFVWMNKTDEGADPVLKQAVMRVEYPNGMILLKLPPP